LSQHLESLDVNKHITAAITHSLNNPAQPSNTTMASESKPPFPPFTRETAQQKVKAAQAAWNTK
jgi:hypothetical protein